MHLILIFDLVCNWNRRRYSYDNYLNLHIILFLHRKLSSLLRMEHSLYDLIFRKIIFAKQEKDIFLWMDRKKKIKKIKIAKQSGDNERFLSIPNMVTWLFNGLFLITNLCVLFIYFVLHCKAISNCLWVWRKC